MRLVKDRLERAQSVGLTVDGWTSRAQDHFFSVTAHYIVDDGKSTFLASDLLTCMPYTDRHTAVNLTKMLEDVLNEWQISHKVTAIVTDNAANMVAAVREGHWRHWGCFAHTLNLIAQSGLKEVELVLEKVKAIVRLFRKSNYASSQLHKTMQSMQMQPLKVFNDVPTRWNSTYEMLKRFLMLRTPLISSLAIVKSSARVTDEVLSNVNILENDEWVVIEQIIEVMDMFEMITTLISTQKHISSSTVIIYVKRLIEHLCSLQTNELVPTTQKLVDKLLSEINQRFADLEKNVIISQSTILDPRFKKFGFGNKSRYHAAVEILYNKVASVRLQSDPPSEGDVAIEVNRTNLEKRRFDKVWKAFDAEVMLNLRPQNQRSSAIIELDKYLAEPLLLRKDKNGKDNCPLLWWHQRKHIYPRLYEIMKTRLCIPATSVPCERIFSHAGQILTQKRENIDSSKLSKMVFLNYNIDNKDF